MLIGTASFNGIRPQNSPCGIVTYRTDNKPDLYLPERSVGRVWGGGKGNVPSVRARTQPNTTVGTVRFCTLYTKFPLVLNFSRSLSIY